MKPVEIEDIVKRLHITPSDEMYKKTLSDTLQAQQMSRKQQLNIYKPGMWRMIMASKAGCLAAVSLIIASWIVSFVMFGKVTELKDELELARRENTIAPAPIDETATINFYLREHQDIIAQKASLGTVTPPVHMQVNQDDIMYYEFLDDGPEFMRPGIIVRGPLSQHRISTTESPAISNGHTLTLPEARQAADFALVSPSWLYPGYTLDQIRRIDGRDALQMLYVDGINSVSLFEQPLDGQRGLDAQDFREYAVYCNQGQVGGTILAWRDHALSYVLIGNIEMSQLMDMAQSISAGNERE